MLIHKVNSNNDILVVNLLAMKGAKLENHQWRQITPTKAMEVGIQVSRWLHPHRKREIKPGRISIGTSLLDSIESRLRHDSHCYGKDVDWSS